MSLRGHRRIGCVGWRRDVGVGCGVDTGRIGRGKCDWIAVEWKQVFQGEILRFLFFLILIINLNITFMINKTLLLLIMWMLVMRDVWRMSHLFIDHRRKQNIHAVPLVRSGTDDSLVWMMLVMM